MSQPSYVTVSGATQGQISKGAFTADSVGNIYQEGHEDTLFCQSVSYEVALPRDPQSGQVTGQRVHQPAKILKYVDKASPMLMQALASGELLQIEADFYRTATSGKQEKYYTVKFTDAILVHYKQHTPNPLDPANAAFRDMEELAFTYRMIDVTHVVAGTSGSDDWRSPKS
ncbi:Hcp family type VI secretion system effector [Roseomonas sp. NAR14]|uniref:Hcp family type VI secretion system effector n=1 Tax=Roseomonas acroporae TaxID=2937791 RepID=A0A9X2BT82_9PROT|nr:Hcp family type VI secretion system effector [Roseomonas acroporae]MCK8784363.1 Hcp family type VI secretion system effector [Roseomonas acroporae]